MHHSSSSDSLLHRVLARLRSARSNEFAPRSSPETPSSTTPRQFARGLVTVIVLLTFSGTVRAGTLYFAKLSAANENPPTASTATGLGVLILNDAETQATITATHNISLPVTGGHIHRGVINTNGPVIFPFPAPTSPVGPLTWNIPAADVVNLKNLGLYMNFHTAVNPGGAIRSQLVRALLAPSAATPAEMNVANILDISAGYDSDLDQVLIQTNLAAATVQAQTLDDLSGRTVYAPVREEIETMASFMDSIFAYADDARLSPTTPVGQYSAFITGGSDFGQRSASVNQAGSTVSRPFAIAGVDYRLNETTHSGVAVGYSDGQDKFDGGVGKTKTKLTALEAFMSTQVGNSGVVLDGAVGYGWAKINSTRNLPSLVRTATASPHGNVWSAALKASKVVTLNDQLTLAPYAMIDAQDARVDAYTESGAGAADLVVRKRTSWNSALEGGATLLIPIKMQPGTLTARIQAGWHYLLEDGAATISTRLAGSPIAFPTQIDGPGKSAAHVEASLTAAIGNGATATLGYRGLLSGNGQTINAVEARVVFRF